MDEQFIFVCCQRGAEPALKFEVANNWPDLRFAFSRPGFITFKNCGKPLADHFDLKSVFARTYGFSVGKLQGQNIQELSQGLTRLSKDSTFDHIHIWTRDQHKPNHSQFLPGDVENEIAEKLFQVVRCTDQLVKAERVNRVASIGQNILDVVVVDENHWWVGRHIATSHFRCQPGGIFPIKKPDCLVSRAYLKMEEALSWSKLPMRPGDKVVEIGSAPGGACQALLQRGMHVIGIDPSDMHDTVSQNPNFTHIRKRGSDLKRCEFAGIRWLAIDTNVAPKHTLDTLEGIVTHPKVKIQGMLITLKLLDWDLANQIPTYVERVRSWNYKDIRCRQLAYNRQEICMTAMKNRSSRRPR